MNNLSPGEPGHVRGDVGHEGVVPPHVPPPQVVCQHNHYVGPLGGGGEGEEEEGGQVHGEGGREGGAGVWATVHLPAHRFP